MPILLGLLWLVNAFCIVHSIRNGRANYWLFILIAVPGLGSLAYFLFELLPEMRDSKTGQKAEAEIRRSLDPDKALRAKAKAFDVSGSPKAAADLAEELNARGFHEDAIALYRRAMTGLFEHDPLLLIGLAAALADNKDLAGARAALERVQQHNPGHQSREGHLLYARVVEAQGDSAQACEEYEALIPTYPGPEAKVRYAMLLDALGRPDKSQLLYRDVVRAHEDRRNTMHPEDRPWLDEAQRRLRQD